MDEAAPHEVKEGQREPLRLVSRRDGGPVRIFVLLASDLDAEAYRRRWEAGQEPDASPYGFHWAESYGGEVRFSRKRDRRGVVSDLIGRGLQRLSGFDILHAFHNRRAMSRADILWTMTEQEALAICLLIRLRLMPRVPLIGATVWMVHRWDEFGPLRRAFYRWLLPMCMLVTVHSAPCLARLRSIQPRGEAMLLPFGVAGEMFRPDLLAGRPRDDGPIRIVAAGNDLTRDWQTLIAAFAGDRRFHLTILSRRVNPQDCAHYDNVSVLTGIGAEAIRNLYLGATYIAVPMKENMFSGITVALEGAGLGVPVLCSRTGGVPTYFDESEVLYAAVGDAEDMRGRILGQMPEARAAMARAAQARFREGDYSTFGMIGRYVKATNRILRGSPAAGEGDFSTSTG